jgi:hypothetical protein
MTDQRDVQQLIQSLGSSAVNNGNPNTIYNASPFPMTNGAGDWYYPAGNAMQMFMPSFGGGLPYGGGGFGGGGNFFNLPSIGGGTIPTYPNIGGGATPPPVTVTPTGGGTTPPAQTGGGGGGLHSGIPTYTGNGGGGYTWDTYGGGGQGTYGGAMDFGSGGGGSFGGFGSSAGGGGSSLVGSGNGLWGVSPALAGQLGLNQDGSIGFGQLLDVITEPFMHGDFYNSQTGTFNWGAVGQTLTGIPFLNKFLQWIGQKQLTDKDPSNDDSFFAKLVKAKAENKLDKQNNVLKAELNNATRFTNQNLFDHMDFTPEGPTKTPNVQIGDMINDKTGQVMPYVGGNAGYNPSTGTSVGGMFGGMGGGVYGTATTSSNGGNITNGYGALSNDTPAYNGPFRSGPAGTGSNGNAVGAGGGGGGGFTRGTFGATVLSGDAARAAFSGMAAGSDKAIKDALAAEARRQAR